MGVFNGAFPILPGKEDAARAFAAAAVGEQRANFDAAQRVSGVTRETWTMAQTPAGTLMLVWFEGEVDGAFDALATNQDDFHVWMRAQILDCTGVDMAVPSDAPPPEFVLDWSA